MNEPITTYTVRGKDFPVVLEFQYHLNGVLTTFKIVEGELSDKFRAWLFTPQTFPYKEQNIKPWTKKKNIEVIVGKPNITFDVFWKCYDYPLKKVMAERAWNKLSKNDKISAIEGIKRYNGFLHRKVSQSKAYPSTYLNQRYWEDSHGSL